MTTNKPQPQRSIEQITEHFTQKTGITQEQIFANKKPLTVAHKQALCYLIHQEGYSMRQIALALNTAKSNIQFSIQKTKDYLSINDPMIKSILSKAI